MTTTVQDAHASRDRNLVHVCSIASFDLVVYALLATTQTRSAIDVMMVVITMMLSQITSRLHLQQSPPTHPLMDRLPIIEPALFMEFKLTLRAKLTEICQSLRSLKKVRINGDPGVEALCTKNGQSLLLGETFCPDVLFIRYFYEKLFQIIRKCFRVILTGNPGISKSVYVCFLGICSH